MKWSAVMPRVALVMLALVASYGVYEFQRVFVPWWIAILSAAAFELVYVAIAVVETPDKRRAAAIAFTAVAVSVVYNSLAALFTRRPALLEGVPLWADAVLAALHGAPLAIVAYKLSVLFVHQRTPSDTSEQEAYSVEQITLRAARHTFTVREWAQIVGVPPSTLVDRAERYRRALEQPPEQAIDSEEASDAS